MKVVWEKSVCSHSGNCVRTLPNACSVVDGGLVVDVTKASEQDIKKIVEQCPAHALRIEEDK